MINYQWLVALCLTPLLWLPMSVIGGEARPSGPEGRAFVERTIEFKGHSRSIFVTMAYPRPDEIFEPLSAPVAPDEHFLIITYMYRGFFWQGVFGTVRFSLDIIKRKPEAAPWVDLESLLQWTSNRAASHNERTKNEDPDRRQFWAEPSLAVLNGVPCIQQYAADGRDQKAELYYYFPFEADYVLELALHMVDNSGRPGLPKSDWRERAEPFGSKLLSTVKVRVE